MPDTRRVIHSILTEAGLKKQLRQRYSDALDLARRGEIYYPKEDMKRVLTQAYRKAQDLNKEGGAQGVYVQHMINPGRVEHKGNSLEAALEYLLSGDREQEISVSVGKVWDSSTSLVLTGFGKLLMSFPTDVETIPVNGRKIPQQSQRSPDSHGWDESILRLSDVHWDTLYVGSRIVGRYGYAYSDQKINDAVREVCDKSSVYWGDPVNVKDAWRAGWDSDITQQEERADEKEEFENQILSLAQEIGPAWDDLDIVYSEAEELDPELIDPYEADYARYYDYAQTAQDPTMYLETAPGLNSEECLDQLRDTASDLFDVIRSMTSMKDKLSAAIKEYD